MGKVTSLTIEELEEALESILPVGYEIKHTRKGIVVYTFLKENAYGELISLKDEDDDDDDSMFDDEDMESLTEDEDSDD